MPKHGEIRAMWEETKTEYGEFTGLGGKVYNLPVGSISQSVHERWCETCGKWVEAKGIMGGLLCPECTTPWIPIKELGG